MADNVNYGIDTSESLKKKLITEYDRYEGDTIPTEKDNSNIPDEFLVKHSIDGIVTDPENRTLWVNGMPYGNAYVVPSVDENTPGPKHSEIFNDFDNNVISNTANYAHIEGMQNRINGTSEAVHIEGKDNKANNGSSVSHLEGLSNTVNSGNTHVEGKDNVTASSATGSHVEGHYNIAYNPYEHAEGEYNWSQLYSDENGGDITNTNNMIVSSIGNGYAIAQNNGSITTRRNAVRVNKDGAVYLGPVSKTTGTIAQTFNPCNYDGTTIFKNNAINSNQKEEVSKSVQELLYGIGHMESVTYWKLRNMAENNKLLPGKSYRIIDYNIGISENYQQKDSIPTVITSAQKVSYTAEVTTPETDVVESQAKYTITENDSDFHRFDIIVTATSESEFSHIAKAIAHDYYDYETGQIGYFENTNFNAWTLYYDFFGTDINATWTSGNSTSPAITIKLPSMTEFSDYCESFFKSTAALIGLYNGEVEQTEDALLSQVYYNDGTEYGSNPDDIRYKSYFKLATGPNGNNKKVFSVNDNIDADDNIDAVIWAPAVLDPKKYYLAEPYFYMDETEKEWQNNPNHSNADGHKPYTGNVHAYNYKWIVDIEPYDQDKQLTNKVFEYCILTAEADLSNYTATGAKTTNILLCKNDKSIDITEIYDESPNSETPKYYELDSSLAYVIELAQKTGVENTYKYNAYIYGGPYLGIYKNIEPTEATQDIWYILEDYNPSEGIYTAYTDIVGTKSFLVNHSINGAKPDFNNWNTLQNFVKDGDKWNFFEQTQATLSLSSEQYTLAESTEQDGTTSYYINTDGEAYKKSDMTYSYENSIYTIWEQQKTASQDITSFIISNPGDNNSDVDINNVFEVKLISVPERIIDPTFYTSIESTTILEYIGIKFLGDSNNGTVTDGTDSLTFSTEDCYYIKNTNNNLTYNGSRYVTVLNYGGEVYTGAVDTTAGDYKKYRILAEYTLNTDYAKNTNISLSANFETKYFAEVRLIPISYVEVADGNYFTEGKFESTGVIYRMIDEYGNDCPYDFKNIKFYNGIPFTGSATEADNKLKYSYTFDGVINGQTTIVDNGAETIANIQNPYSDASNIGDKSLNGSCINNVITNTGNGTIYSLPNVFFRLDFSSQMVNNTFINCSDTGCINKGYPLTNGANISMVNNVFKECNTFDIFGYSTITNTTFYDCSGKLFCTPESYSTINNSTISSTDFVLPVDTNNTSTNDFTTQIETLREDGKDKLATYNFNINNSEIISGLFLIDEINKRFFISKFNSPLPGATQALELLRAAMRKKQIIINNSKIIDDYLTSFSFSDDDMDNSLNIQYYVTSLPGVSLNSVHHSIIGESNKDLQVTTDKYITFRSDDAFIPSTPINISSYTNKTQIFTLDNEGFYNKYEEGGRKSSAPVSGNPVTVTLEFDKQTTTDISSGTAYTFPKNRTEYSNGGPNNGKALFNLGCFYVEHWFNIYTKGIQSKSAWGSGSFNIEVTVHWANGADPTTETVSTSNKYSYWSKNDWNYFYLTSIIDFTKYTFNNTDIRNAIYNDNGTNKFIICESDSTQGINDNEVKKNISKIVLKFTGDTKSGTYSVYDNSAYAYISRIYHKDTSWDGTTDRATIQGSPTLYYYTSLKMPYYIPSIYTGTSNKPLKIIADNKGIWFYKNSQGDSAHLIFDDGDNCFKFEFAGKTYIIPAELEQSNT